MNTAENSYCRLCAELKPNDKLLNLQFDINKRRETIEKLIKVNAHTDFSGDLFPKTVCFVCLSSLDHAFEFVCNVEQAESVLSGIFFVQHIKDEVSKVNDSTYSDDENQPLLDSQDEKVENVSVKSETERENITEIEDISLTERESFDITEKEDDPLTELTESEELTVTEDSECLEKSDVKLKTYHQKTQCKEISLNLDIPSSQLELTWKDYDWTCSICETQFSTINELSSHSMQYHARCNAFRCTDCKRQKLRLDKFLIHVKRHRQYLKLSCYKCHEKFPSPTKLMIHVKEHKNTSYICDGCNTTFQTQEELNSHTKSFYMATVSRSLPAELPKLADGLTCSVCNKTFNYLGNLKKHLLIHTDRKRDQICEKCGKCFFRKADLLSHSVHHDNVRPHQCEICKATFKTLKLLRRHVGNHGSIKPFACEKCGRCFRLQRQLTSHSIIHTDSLPHVCSFCNKRFRFKSILKKHIRQHTGVKPYSCPVCQRDFTDWGNYNKHMKRRHDMNMAKKKHTPDGACPIDPATGEVIKYTETTKTLEWKRQILIRKRPERQRLKLNDRNKIAETEKDKEVLNH